MNQIRKVIAASLRALARKVDKKPRFEVPSNNDAEALVYLAREVSKDLATKTEKVVEWDGAYGRPIRSAYGRPMWRR